MKKKNINLFLAVVMIAGILALPAIAAFAGDGQASVTYLTYDAKTGAVVEHTTQATAITSETEVIGNGWYVVDRSFEHKGLQVNGNANLILKNNCTLTVKGIDVPAGKSLTIYAQSSKTSEMGTIIANGSSHAGIGAGSYTDAGSITINGGNIKATGGWLAAGIGGGYGGNGGNVKIGGNCSVYAIADSGEQAIGRGASGSSDGTFTIANGFTVTNNLTGKTAFISEFISDKEVSITVDFVPVPYLEPGNSESRLCTDYQYVDSYYNISFTTGCYVITGGTTNNPITVNGNVALILQDGCTLNAAKGIRVPSGSSLTIYGQSTDENQMGKLIATGEEDCAGIGGGYKGNGGTVTINGGKIEATGGRLAAGIGGGSYGNGGTVTVNGGYVVANGEEYGAGIGGGYYGTGGKFTISGGYVEANGGYDAAGIGGGFESAGGTVTVNGGKVVANTKEHAASSGCTAGIGGGSGADGGTVTINGGYVEANGGNDAAGIGGSYMGAGGNVTVNGGYVEANGGSSGAGIGSGDRGNGSGEGGTVTINGGYVVANGGEDAAGIGGGEDANGAAVRITGPCTVKAEAGRDAPLAIGNGKGGAKRGTLEVNSGLTVTDNKTGVVKTSGKLYDTDWFELLYGESVDFTAINGKTSYYIKNGERSDDLHCTVMADNVIVWADQWYVVSGEREIPAVTVSGNVNLILEDGCKLTVNNGIRVEEGSSLTVYAQSTDSATMGKLYSTSSTDSYAGIGSGPNKASGNITIYGGYINATGGKQAAGIGGGSGKKGTVKIYGGEVEAFGGQGGGAGIGGGSGSSGSCNVLIDGKTIVNAKGGLDETNTKPVGPGIGCGAKNTNSVVELRDGSVHAEGAEAVKASQILLNAYEDYAIKVTTDNGKTFKYYLAKSPVEFSGKTEAHLEPVINSERPIEKDDIPFMAYKDGRFEKVYFNAYTYRSTGSFTREETLTTGWYVLDSGTAAERITISGDVKIILLNGADCYFRCGIGLHSGSKLSIYAQPAEAGKSIGKLSTGGIQGGTTVSGYNNEKHIGGAGIGGDFYPDTDKDATCGDVYIYGGKLDIKGGKFSAGIGGAGDDDRDSYHVGNGGNVYIYGGDVTVTGGECAAGIGGGAADEKAGNGGNTYIYGGIVHAYGGNAAAGIGGGTMIDDNVFRSNEGTGGSGGNFVMYGGEVYAYGGNTSPLSSKKVGGGAGIGGGLFGVGGSVTVYGGTLEAIGAEDATGIGGGGWSVGGKFTLNGGKVIAKGGRYGAGIGGGREAGGSDVSLNGGELDVTFGYETFAIGGGDNINAEGTISVGDGLYVFDCRAKYIVNPDAGSRNWYSVFHGKDYVHVKLIPSENFDMLIPVDYLAYKEATKDFELTTNNETIPVVNKGTTLATWDAGWYVVDKDAEVDQQVKVNGNVNLIIKNGCTFNAKNGIYVSAGSSLTIYGQTTDESEMGHLIANGVENCAGIGGGNGGSGGTVTINCGYIEATGGNGGAGIGGGNGGSGGTVTINCGHVDAAGGSGGAGIGGGSHGTGGKFTINDGYVEANGGENAAGIGGGNGGNAGTVTINDGYVEANGGKNAAGIGGGNGGNAGTVTVNGGNVVANTKEHAANSGCAAGIGGGSGAKGGTVTINYGYVEANGGNAAAGIGGGYMGAGGTVTINDGNVEANGGRFAAGIGGGQGGNAGAVTINGGYVEANGSLNGAGIGGGSYGNGGTVTVTGGYVVATGEEYGAGIGGGFHGSGDKFTISDGYVEANGGYNAAGIGGGFEGAAGTVTVNGGKVVANTKEHAADSGCAAGIGGGSGVKGGTVTINGGYVEANGGNAAAGIGGSYMGAGGTVTVNGGYVEANGGYNAAGIGGGNRGNGSGDGGTFTINGGEVMAAGGTNGAGIGGGLDGSGGNVKLSGGKVTAAGGKNAPGIGGGNGGSSGAAIKITGSCDVIAEAGTYAPRSIGSGLNNTNLGTIEVTHGIAVTDNNTGSLKTSGKTYETDWFDFLKGTSVDITVTINQKYSYYITNGTKSDDLKCTIMTNDAIGWSDPWYVVSGECTISSVKVTGNVNIILEDGCKLTVGGINAPAGSTLTIYAQSQNENEMGKLITQGADNCAGIGGNADEECGIITVNGGYIEATGGNYAAGIGGGYGGLVTVNGGKVVATGGDRGAGIGGGRSCRGGNFIINGGDVTAIGGTEAAGIGGGCWGFGNSATIAGGKVYAQGGDYAAGIGGGMKNNGGTVTVNGGDVTAIGGIEAAGIGGGDEGYGGTITVNGGEVRATGGGYAAGIGGGEEGKGGTFTINGGNVTATGGRSGAGIGGGSLAAGGDVTLAGGNVTATGGNMAAGIGGGYSNSGGNIKITGSCTVTAKGKGTFALGNGLSYNPSIVPGTIKVDNGLSVINNKTGAVKTSGKLYETDWFELLYGESVDFTVVNGTTSYYVVNGTRYDRNGTIMTNEVTGWSDPWYVVSGDCTIPSVTVKGNVNLILEDRCTLYVSNGILIEEGSSLTIYSQSTTLGIRGKLEAVSTTDGYAGIGSGPSKASGNITIYGGNVIGRGGKQAAGIGGGSNGTGTVTIYNGGVSGYSGEGGAGIGGGYNGAGVVSIYGGTVTGSSKKGGGAGIGGGADIYGLCNVIIDGNAIVSALGGTDETDMSKAGPGIGSRNGMFSLVEIRNGSIHSKGGSAIRAAMIAMNPYTNYAIKLTYADGRPITTFPSQMVITELNVADVYIETIAKTSQIDDGPVPTDPSDPTNPTSPETGDTSNMTLWIVLMLVSVMGICVCLIFGKRKRTV